MTTPSNQQPEAISASRPRTDAHKWTINSGHYMGTVVTDADFAERLEHELAEAKILLKKSRDLLHHIRLDANGIPMYLYDDVQSLINEIDAGGEG